MIQAITGVLTGIIATLGGIHFMSQIIIKKKIRKILRSTIKELIKIEEEMDKDSPRETLEKIGNLASKLGKSL